MNNNRKRKVLRGYTNKHPRGSLFVKGNATRVKLFRCERNAGDYSLTTTGLYFGTSTFMMHQPTR